MYPQKKLCANSWQRPLEVCHNMSSKSVSWGGGGGGGGGEGLETLWIMTGYSEPRAEKGSQP